MRLRANGRLLIAACCAMVLLAVQVLGLHYHRHIDVHPGHGAHAAVLSVWDAASHVPDADAVHAAHPVADLDIEVVSLAASKLKFKPAPVLLALLPLADLPSAATQMAAPPQRTAPPLPGASPFSLRPPSQAPPSLA